MSHSDPARIFAPHDHAACAETALARADRVCAEAGARLTPVRQRTLEILLESHLALGAYDILERLAAEGFGHQPPVAYRALDFLVERGLAHRIEHLNAFTACTGKGSPGEAPVFFICEQCHRVAEASSRGVRRALAEEARSAGFSVRQTHIEVLGLCPACKEATGA